MLEVDEDAVQSLNDKTLQRNNHEKMKGKIGVQTVNCLNRKRTRFMNFRY
jgi:predicted metal-binding protein